MSDNQTKRFHQLISEGRIVFKAAAYTQSEDGEHPEHITFKLDFSSSDSVAVFGAGCRRETASKICCSGTSTLQT